MLSKKDKDDIRKIIREEVTAAFMKTITIERGPRQPGDPEKVIRDEQWNVLDFLVSYIPHIEAALRGMQSDIDRTKNNLNTNTEKLNVVGQTLISIEDSARIVAALAGKIQEVEAERRRIEAPVSKGALER
jgi:hypothetical protein